jgi:predicted transcriptional regulator
MLEGNLIFKERQAKMLVLLLDNSRDWYISTLAKESQSTYVHACNFLLSCESLGIVESERHGRMKSIKLTEKGMQIARMVSDIIRLATAPVPVQPIPETPPEQ